MARTGVLHGEAAKANVSPARYACTPCKWNISKLKIIRLFRQPASSKYLKGKEKRQKKKKGWKEKANYLKEN